MDKSANYGAFLCFKLEILGEYGIIIAKWFFGDVFCSAGLHLVVQRAADEYCQHVLYVWHPVYAKLIWMNSTVFSEN